MTAVEPARLRAQGGAGMDEEDKEDLERPGRGEREEPVEEEEFDRQIDERERREGPMAPGV